MRSWDLFAKVVASRILLARNQVAVQVATGVRGCSNQTNINEL
jgi:hypothetical protein